MARIIERERTFNIIVMLGMLVIILAGLRAGAEMVVPFILAVFVAVILNPLVRLLQRIGVPRVLGVSLLIGVIVLAGALLLATLVSMLNDFARTLPQYRAGMLGWLLELQEMAGHLGVPVSTEALVTMVDPNLAAQSGQSGAVESFWRGVRYFSVADDRGIYAVRSAAIDG